MKKTIVIYPSPLIGHLISMVELGKLILHNYPSFNITVLITTMNAKTTNQTTPYINKISDTTPSIVFHHLPARELEKSQTIFEYLRQNNQFVHQSLDFISRDCEICSFIFDMFCSASLEVTAELQIPSYFFYTSGVNALTVLLHLPSLNNACKSAEQGGESRGLLSPNTTYLSIPGLPPILSTDLPSSSLNPNDASHEPFMFISKTANQSKGIIVNSFESLELRAVKAIKGGLCNTSSAIPPLYPVGPLIAEPTASDGTCECLSWLDEQPRQSVVFLCFGSGGVFSGDQLNEIAAGLEKSGKRFLWVVRTAFQKGGNGHSLAPTDPSLDEMLPEGFLERTRERGLVVKNWAPQVDVLNRESVGGFVTHCGWNSILESVCAGVPMIGWPLYAEQRVNRVALVKEMKLSLWLNELENGLVTANEVEERVNTLMDSEEGRALKDRVEVARDEAKLALSDGGSTRSALVELVESWSQLIG